MADEKLIHEDDTQRVFESTGPDWTSTRVEWKDGHEPPPSIEERVEAIAALAEKASATAQEVAQAARDGRAPQ